MPRNPAHARDAALRRMRRLSRWLIAGSVVVTGLLTDVAAHAFPGRTITRTAGRTSVPRTVGTGSATPRGSERRARHHALKPAAQTPKAHPQVVEPVPGATSAPVTQAPATAAPAAPVQSAPVQAAPAPTPAPAPVVSGGS